MNTSNMLHSLHKTVSFLAAKIPWSYNGIISRELGRGQTVLDVGCGDGSFMYAINRDKRNDITGVDIFAPSLAACRRLGVYKKLVKQDIRKLSFPKKSFGVVIANNVIEHLTKKDGLFFIDTLEKIAKKKVVIITPVGFFEQHEHSGNAHQEHLSSWEAEEFLKKGYNVIGQGWGIYSRNKFMKKLCEKIGPLNNLFFIVTVMLHPLFKRRYKLSHELICIKTLKDAQRHF